MVQVSDEGRGKLMSTKARWLRSHIERLLQEEWDSCRVSADGDGDYPFRTGTAACWVQVLDYPRPMVRVLAQAAIDIPRSAKLLAELNDIQNRAMTATVRWSDGAVLVSQTLSPHGLNRKTLRQALQAVGGVADDIGLLLAGMFAGATPFTAESSVDEGAC
jgi:hypothetical protein